MSASQGNEGRLRSFEVGKEMFFNLKREGNQWSIGLTKKVRLLSEVYLGLKSTGLLLRMNCFFLDVGTIRSADRHKIAEEDKEY